ncbi:MAG: PcfB family protein [Oscillospiraceae bacterium]|jgi:hypothetical protein|nr:PcfB family protein [Oscillospiraceae bacterium]
MQDQLNEKTAALYIKGAKLTGRTLAKAMRAFLKKAREPPKGKVGKQSIRTLTKQGASLSNITIDSDNIGGFQHVARKYNVSYALSRDDSENPPKWVVFFKAKDADALTAAFTEYSKGELRRKPRKPSLLSRLERFKKLAKSRAEPVKNRGKGGHER